MSSKTRPVNTSYGPGGRSFGKTSLSPSSNKVYAQVTAPPPTVVPIIFVPGIMGSNLRSSVTGKSVWNANSTFSLAKQWIFRGSTTRQEKLDPKTTEVDPNGDFIGPSATVPDKKTATDRGWGGVSKEFYGDFLRYLDNELNGPVTQAPWPGFEDKAYWGPKWNAERPFDELSSQEGKKTLNFFCPVHAVGYNWLRSNAEAGKHLASEITRIIDEYANIKIKGINKFTCKQVILVSHSMGGLVSRAAVHSNMGNASNNVLGVIHGAMPANGAAAAYHHARGGYGFPPGLVLGNNAAQVTAVFANAVGALQLLPNHQYGSGWLKTVTEASSQPLFTLPKADPYVEIYSERKRWWRLVNEDLIDPAGTHQNTASTATPWVKYKGNLLNARDFHYELATTYHANTYAHYGADPNHLAYGDLIWLSSSKITLSKQEVFDASQLPQNRGNPIMLNLGDLRVTRRGYVAVRE